MRDVSTAAANAVTVLVSAGLAASCGIGELTTADPPGIAVRDSAGVEIVEVGGAYLDDLPLWRIGDEPIVSIGEIEGEEPYVFAGMGRAGIEAFDDGSLAIVDGAGPRGSREIRVFDRHGTLIRILRVLRPPTPLTADEQRAVLASTPENVRFQGETVTPHRPEFGYVRFGAGDDLWVPDYRSVTLGDAEAPERITLFGVDGRPVARLEVPPDPIYRDQRRATLSEARSDRNHFRIVTADALGIERLLVFEILK